MSTPLWKPSESQIANSHLTRFAQAASSAYQQPFDTYQKLYTWSVEQPDQFWSAIWEEANIIHSQTYDSVLTNPIMPGARWFEGARLNFAENLLKYRDDRLAIIHWREDTEPIRLTYAELFGQVAACARGLIKLGVTKGDRVAALVPNLPEVVIAMLATTSIGAVWSSCSPDFGHQGVLDRFSQIEPKVLISIDGYTYNSKSIDCLPKIEAIVQHIPAIESVVLINLLGHQTNSLSVNTTGWNDLLSEPADQIEFAQLPFDHPVYIMYSSGTTGVPKCIVHGAGGTLLQHYKEHVLHTNLSRDDRISYFTTCGWMMWNWLVSALQVGATIFLYEGSPAWPDLGVLWRAIEREQLTVFGTSPKFLASCQQADLEPNKSFDLSSLRTILSTGAPLTAENFAWVYEHVKEDVQLASISGGTDIVSCFMLGNPNLPVYSEEIQCRGLGMKVETFSDEGQPVIGEIGELVCTAPFPSMPVSFWNDADGSKYRRAYFEDFPGVWRHGDYIKITEHGGVIVHGRSDATLNPGGVRIGTAEIYNSVEARPEVVDSIVVAQKWQGDVRIVLFVVLQDNLTLTQELQKAIKQTIRERATPRHVPAIILQVTAIPQTINGKKVEIAVTRMIHGQAVPNRDALANPDSLDQFIDLPALR